MGYPVRRTVRAGAERRTSEIPVKGCPKQNETHYGCSEPGKGLPNVEDRTVCLRSANHQRWAVGPGGGSSMCRPAVERTVVPVFGLRSRLGADMFGKTRDHASASRPSRSFGSRSQGLRCRFLGPQPVWNESNDGSRASRQFLERRIKSASGSA